MYDFGCVDLLCQLAAFFISAMVLTASKLCWILPEESAHNEKRCYIHPHPITQHEHFDMLPVTQ